MMNKSLDRYDIIADRSTPWYKLKMPKGQFVLYEDHIKIVDTVIHTLSKIQYLIDTMELEDGCFTFPDGDTWWKSNHDTIS